MLIASSTTKIDPLKHKGYAETIPGSKVSFEMVAVPGGTFMMGSPASEAGRGEDEGPQASEARAGAARRTAEQALVAACPPERRRHARRTLDRARQFIPLRVVAKAAFTQTLDVGPHVARREIQSRREEFCPDVPILIERAAMPRAEISGTLPVHRVVGARRNLIDTLLGRRKRQRVRRRPVAFGEMQIEARLDRVGCFDPARDLERSGRRNRRAIHHIGGLTRSSRWRRL